MVDWDAYRRSDGSISLLTMASNKYGTNLKEESKDLIRRTEDIHRIKSRQVAAQILALISFIQE